MSSTQSAVVDQHDGTHDHLQPVGSQRRWWVLVLAQITVLTFGVATTATNVGSTYP